MGKLVQFKNQIIRQNEGRHNEESVLVDALDWVEELILYKGIFSGETKYEVKLALTRGGLCYGFPLLSTAQAFYDAILAYLIDDTSKFATFDLLDYPQ